MLQSLQQRLRAARRNDGGFTLIELLIVIVILGVLAGVVVFSVRFVNDRGVTTACKTDKKNVQVAVEAYYAKQSAYPANMQALVDAGILQEAPSSDKYTITYDGQTHIVSGAPTC